MTRLDAFSIICSNDDTAIWRCEMEVKLKEVCEVQLGYAFRTRIEPAFEGNISVIQMKDLTSQNLVDSSDLVRIHFDDMKDHHFVRKGDLAFRSRGLDTTSALIMDEITECVIAAPLYLLRVKEPERLNPSYLNWFISQSKAQTWLRKRTEGSNQKMVSRQALEEMVVDLPIMEKQMKVIEIVSLGEHETSLLKKLTSTKKVYTNAVLQRYAEGEAK